MQNHICIFGYYGFQNTGDDAVLQSMLDDFRKEQKNIEFTVFSNDPEATAAQYQVHSIKWDDFYRVAQAIGRSDLLIIGGGGLYNCYLEYSKEMFLKGNHSYFSVTTFGLPLLAALYNKPCMVFGVGASEIVSIDAKNHISIGLKACNVITVRDPVSKNILEQLSDSETSEIIVTADPVFRLEEGADYGNDERLKNVQKLPKPVLGISLRNWTFSGDQEKTVESVSKAINEFSIKHGGSIVFLPFDNGRVVGDLSDDNSIFSKIIPLLDKKVNYYKLDGYLHPQIASMIIKLCDFCICMRLHSVIMSIKNSVPFIGIAYDQKVRNIMEMLDLGQLAINISEIDVDILFNKLNQIYFLRQKYKELLTEKALEMKSRAKDNINIALKLLHEPKVNSNRYKPGVVDSLLESYADTLEEKAFEKTKLMTDKLFDAGNYKEFIKYLEKSDLETDGELCYRFAFALHNTGQYKEAEEYYAKAEKLGFSKFWIYYNRGQLYYSLGEDQKADEDIKKAYKINPEHEGIKKIIERTM